MIYVFGDFKLDGDCRELTLSGQPISLRPKVYDVLLLLVQRRDHVVSRDDMLNSVWAGRYVSDATLSSSIKELRKALGDSGREKRYIKTIHAAGFRFVGGVTESDNFAPSAPSPPTPPSTHSSLTKREVDVTPKITPSESTKVAKLVDERPEFAGERKSISALRCSIFQADELAEAIGSERLHDVMQDLFKMSQEVVEMFNGQVTQWLSDGFLALFGIPVAQEDHARRALSAARRLQRTATQHWPESPVKLTLAMTSGTVIVGSVPGQPQHYFTASGAIMRLAETLCHQAGAGKILVCEDSYRLLRAEVRAHPIDNDINCWQIDDFFETGAGVPRRFRRDYTKLIGRDWEMSLMQQQLQRAADGNGQVIAMSGQPGIGKSRLLNDFQSGLAEGSAFCLKINCLPQTQGTPYYALAEFLRQYCSIADNEPTPGVGAKLASALGRAGIEHKNAKSLLMQLLNSPVDQHGSGANPSQLNSQARRDLTFSILHRLFLQNRQVTLVLVEDIHWMDESSVLWLASLISQLNDCRLLMVTSVRPGFKADWLTLPWVTQLTLPPLSKNHCWELLRQLPQRSSIKQSFTKLVELSCGNPFYLGELALNSTLESSLIPGTIQGVLTARIDQLLPQDKQVLQLAAIIGQRGSLSLLMALEQHGTTNINDSMLRLQAAELLFSNFDDGSSHFVFKHSLVQEVVYHNQMEAHRRSMHAIVAATARREFPQLCSNHPEFPAYHYDKAEQYVDASRFWQRAAHQALQRSAFVEAIAFVAKGRATLKQLPPTDNHTRIELAMLQGLALAQVAILGYGSAEVKETLLRAQTLCEALDDEASLFRILAGLCNFHLVRCEFKQAFTCNRRMFQLSRRLDAQRCLISSKAARGELLMHYGRLDLAKRYFEQCITLTEIESNPLIAGTSSLVTSIGQAAWVSWYLGEEADALHQIERSVHVARQLEQPFILAVALCLCAELHRLRNQHVLAERFATEAAKLSAEQAFPYWNGSALVTLGWATTMRGEETEGIQTITRGIDVFKSTGASLQISSHLQGLADAHRVAGNTRQALVHTENAIDWACKTKDRHRLPTLLKLQAQLSKHDLESELTGQPRAR